MIVGMNNTVIRQHKISTVYGLDYDLIAGLQEICRSKTDTGESISSVVRWACETTADLYKRFPDWPDVSQEAQS